MTDAKEILPGALLIFFNLVRTGFHEATVQTKLSGELMSDSPERELKKRSPRFQLDPPVDATFGAQPVVIFNIGERGIQIETPAKVAPNTLDTLRFSLPTSPRMIRAQARVLWCRAAKKEDSLKSWPYRCGLQLEGIAALSLGTLAQMIELAIARPMPSLPKVQPARPEQRQSQELPRASWVPSPPISLDQTMALVQSARGELSRLTSAQRAALGAEGRRVGTGAFREEIFEIHAYLRHAIEPRVISMVLDISALEE